MEKKNSNLSKIKNIWAQKQYSTRSDKRIESFLDRPPQLSNPQFQEQKSIMQAIRAVISLLERLAHCSAFHLHKISGQAVTSIKNDPIHTHRGNRACDPQRGNKIEYAEWDRSVDETDTKAKCVIDGGYRQYDFREGGGRYEIGWWGGVDVFVLEGGRFPEEAERVSEDGKGAALRRGPYSCLKEAFVH